jgi:Predicted membrane protein
MQNIHPVFVHFPIALLSVGLLFDILGSFFDRDSLRKAGLWCQVFGTAAIIGATITGLLADECCLTHSHEAHRILETHKKLELIATGIFVPLFIWRSISKTHLPQKLKLLRIYFAIGVLGMGIMFYGAHLGGKLVYEFGVGVSTANHFEGHGHHHGH